LRNNKNNLFCQSNDGSKAADDGSLEIFSKRNEGLGTHLLFVKVPRPGDSEVTFSLFESSCHMLLPV